MKKVFEVFKRDFAISFILNSIFIIQGIVTSGTPLTIDLRYIIKNVFTIFEISLYIVPLIVIVDLLFMTSLKSLYKDYKDSDKKGRIILIVICISMLLRKILIWTS